MSSLVAFLMYIDLIVEGVEEVEEVEEVEVNCE
jgi:hypothetical protein